MPYWKLPAAPLEKVDVLLFDRFSNHCLANAVEPMRAANTLLRRQAYSWRFLTVGGEPATSSSGLSVAPDGALTADSRGDYLFIMPSYGHLEMARPTVIRTLRAAARRYKVIAGFDTGSWLMAEAGLLDGRKATIHWDELEAFREKFTEVTVQRARYVVDEDRMTSSGAMAAFDLLLRLIGDRHGTATALEVASIFMQTDAAVRTSPVGNYRSKTTSKALALMQQHLEDPLPLPGIARMLGTSQKQLEARFRLDLGAPPKTVYQRLRLGLARRLVEETDLSVSEITIRSGYQNSSAMTRAFRAEFGASPREIRNNMSSRLA